MYPIFEMSIDEAAVSRILRLNVNEIESQYPLFRASDGT